MSVQSVETFEASLGRTAYGATIGKTGGIYPIVAVVRSERVLSASEADSINRATAHRCMAVAGPDPRTVLGAVTR